MREICKGGKRCRGLRPRQRYRTKLIKRQMKLVWKTDKKTKKLARKQAFTQNPKQETDKLPEPNAAIRKLHASIQILN